MGTLEWCFIARAPALMDNQAIEKVSYTHDAMIDLLIANPQVTQGDLAKAFGYTPGWISRIIRADSFKEALARRKAELTDPILLQSIETNFEVLIETGLKVLQQHLEAAPSFDKALKAVELGSRAMGYGAKGPQVNLQQNFIAHMPQKAATSEEWLETRTVTITPNV
jgi:DNA-binding MarR family transcriptional regulator